MSESKSRWVKVYTFYEIFEQQTLEELLQKNGISAQCISRDDSAYDGLFKASIGLGIIRVPQEFAEEAKEIIASFEKEKQVLNKEVYEDTKKMKKEYEKDLAVRHKNIYFFINYVIPVLFGLIFLAATVILAISAFSTDNRGEKGGLILVALVSGIFPLIVAYTLAKEFKASKKAKC